MYQYPELLLSAAKRQSEGYDKHVAVHRAELESLLRSRRRAALEKRWFRLRHLTRSLLNRLATDLARRAAL